MNEDKLQLWVYDQVDMLIESGYVDPSRRKEVEDRMLEIKKGDFEKSP